MGRPGDRKKRSRARARARAAGLGEHDDDDAAGEEEEEPAAALFPVSAAVEVRIDDEGFARSLYEATVEARLPGCRGYVVAYDTLEDGGSPLRERVAAAAVRPRPPSAPSPRREPFALHEMVDAFHNEGWWAGVVQAVGAGADGEGEALPRRRRVYTVCFPATREVIEFDEARLRPRLVFLGEDRWVPAAQALQENRSPMFREGTQVEVSRSPKTFGEYWTPATVLKVIDATTFLVLYGDVKEDGQPVTEIMDAQYIRPGRNIIRMDSKYRFSPSSFVEVIHEGSWWPGVISEVLDDNLRKKYVVKISGHETEMDDVEWVDVLIVEHTRLRPRYDWYDRKWVRCLAENTNAGSFVGTDLSRKRKEFISSRTPEELGENPEIVLTKKRIVDNNVEDTSQDVASFEEEKKSTNDCKDLSDDATHRSSIPSELDKVASSDSTPVKENKGSHESSVCLRESGVVDKTVRSEIPIQTDAHQGGYIGSQRFGASKVSILSKNSVGTSDEPCEANVTSSDPLNHERGILADQPSESLAVENLPFVKTSPMWAQIEALEVFSRLPQRPHFRQFQQHVPEVREGMALGLMFSFAYLAENIKQLNIKDEIAVFEEKMKGLSSLEAHGFDVTRLRSHLETLLYERNGRAELQDAIKKLEDINHDVEISRLKA